MPRATRESIRAAVRAGVHPYTRMTDKRAALAINHPATGRPLALVADGVLTSAGRYWQEETGQVLTGPAPQDRFEGTPVIVGPRTFINMDGKKRLMATMVDGREKLTRVGQQYYKLFPTTYLIHVPIRVTGHREDGSTYELPATTHPVDWVTNKRMSDPGFEDEARAHALADLGTGGPVRQSNEEADVDEEGQWTISEKQVRNGQATYEMHMPLGQYNGRSSFTVANCNPCETAFLVGPSGCCVVDQLSAALGLDPVLLAGQFVDIARELYKSDEFPFGPEPYTIHKGVTPKMLARWAEQEEYSIHGFWENRKVLHNVVAKSARSICFSFSDCHFYLLDAASTMSASHRDRDISSGRPRLHAIDVAENKKNEKPGDFLPWSCWAGLPPEAADRGEWRPTPGKFCTYSRTELYEIRLVFMKSGRVPILSLCELDQPQTLWYKFTKAEVARWGLQENFCKVRYISPDAGVTAEAAEILDLPPQIEGLASFVARAVPACLRERWRVRVTPKERERIIAKQEGKCRICSADLERCEIDHVNPISASLPRESNELQALCLQCHREKTAQESHKWPSLESHLSDSVWNALVAGPAVQAILLQAARAPDAPMAYADRRLSRQRILESSSYDWPVALPHDEIEEFSGALGDFCYVDMPVPASPKELVAMLPFRGPAWYHKSVVILAQIRGLNPPITHVLRCSCHVKPSTLNDALQEVWKALPPDEGDTGGACGKRWRRDASVRLVGMWGRRSHRTYKCTTSKTPQDGIILAEGGTFYARPVVGSGGFFDYIAETPLVGRHTCYLLYRKVIDEEAALTCELYFRAKAATPRNFGLFEMNTDAILYRGELLPADDNLKVMRTKDHRMVGTHQLPARREPRPEVVPPWLEVPDSPDDECAVRHVMAGGGLCIDALAGCGKTTLMQKLVRLLRQAGRKVHCIAPTHVATSNLEASATTIAHFLHRYGRGIKTEIDYLVVDEMSLIGPYDWTYLATILHHSRAKLIIGGDWYQLNPVNPHYMGQDAPSMRDRAFLREKCGARLVLTVCRRCDDRLFNLYRGIALSSEPLEVHVRAAKAAYPPLAGHSPVNLVCSHARRIALNRILQLQFKPADAVLVKDETPPSLRENKPQDIWVWPGCSLICASRLDGLKNQWSYVVEHCDEEAVMVVEEGSRRAQSFTHAKLVKHFRPGFARTYHSAQSLGFPRVRLWDTESKYFTREHLVTGLSRCRDSSQLDFGHMKDNR